LFELNLQETNQISTQWILCFGKYSER